MKKRIWQLALAMLALYAAVHFAYRWLEGRVDAVLGPGGTAQSLDAGATPDQGGLLTHEAALKSVVGRNLFAAALEGAAEGRDFRLGTVAAEKGPVQLLGTVTGRGAAARAIIKSGPEGRERLYRIGDQVQGAKIVGIERGRVELAASGGPEFLLLKERENTDSRPAGPVVAAEGSTGAADEGAIRPPPSLSDLRSESGRIVPQSLPGRRVNTGASTPQEPARTRDGVPVRTGADALRRLEVPWEGPEQ